MRSTQVSLLYYSMLERSKRNVRYLNSASGPASSYRDLLTPKRAQSHRLAMRAAPRQDSHSLAWIYLPGLEYDAATAAVLEPAGACGANPWP